jgi:putative nucleotidyltransferase with HDIG domain
VDRRPSDCLRVPSPTADTEIVGAVLAGQTDYRTIALANVGRLPPFSPILTRLLATLREDEDVPFFHVAEIIEKDSVLAGHVLRLVNSSLYGRSQTVNSVRHAVSLIGITNLRNLALSLSITARWTRVTFPRGWSRVKFSLHCVGCAVAADLLAQRLPVPYAEGAFTAGLLHDVGKLLIATALPDRYEQIQRLNWEPAVEREILGATHAELSSEILHRWKLPVEIQEAVAAHHLPSPDHCTPVLSDLVSLADRFVILKGLSIDAREAGDPAGALAGWGIDDRIPDVMAEFERELESVRAFF